MNMIRGALHNLSKSEPCDPQYCKGLVVGVMSAIMQERGCLYQEAVEAIVPLLPRDTDSGRLPLAWLPEILEGLESRA